MIPPIQHGDLAWKTPNHTTASALNLCAPTPGSIDCAKQLLSRLSNGSDSRQDDDAQALQRMLQRGGQIKRLADDEAAARAQRHSTVAPPATRLKRNPVSAALAALMLWNPTSPASDNTGRDSMDTPLQPRALMTGSDDVDAPQTRERPARHDGRFGDRPDLEKNALSPAGRLSRVARSVAQDHIEYAAGQIEKDFAARFKILYNSYDGFADLFQFCIKKTVFRNEDGGEVTSENARALLSLTMLDVIDSDLYLMGRQEADRVRIVVLTCLRLMCYASLRKDVHDSDFSRFVYNELLSKNIITIEFVLEKVIYLLTNGDPRGVTDAVSAHFESIKASIADFDLGEIEDSNFRLVARELDRLIRMLKDPQYLSGDVVKPEFEKLKKELGASVIKRVEALKQAYWSGASPGRLLGGLMVLNGEIQAKNVTLTGIALTPDELEVPPLPDAPPCLSTGDGCISLPNNFGADLDAHALTMEILERYIQRTLKRAAELYDPVLNPRLFIDTRLREEIGLYKEETNSTIKLTPSSTLGVTLSPKVIGAPMPPQRRAALSIRRFYTITALATKTYLYNVENIRDAQGRGFLVSFRSMEGLLQRLEQVDLQGEMEAALKRYRENPKITEGRQEMIQGLMVLRCLQYLENSDDTISIIAIQQFLSGKRQAMGLRFHDVPVSGVFYLPTGAYRGIAFDVNNAVFYVATPGIKVWPHPRHNVQTEQYLDFGESEEFRKWILGKIPYYDQLRLGPAPEAFRHKERVAQTGAFRHQYYYSPFSFTPTANRTELASILNENEMDRLASDIDTLVFSSSEQQLQQWLSRAKILATLASIGFGLATLGTGSVIGGACMLSASLGFAFLDAAASVALARSVDRPDLARGHYQDAIAGATLAALFAVLPARSLGLSLHRTLVTVENVDHAMKCLRFIRNGIPDLTRKMKTQRALIPPSLGGGAISPNVHSGAAAGVAPVAGAKDIATDSLGMLATLSKKTFETRAGVRVLQEIQRSHIDGVVMSTHRIDMGNFYVYTLAPQGALPAFEGKRLVFSAHGAYTGDGISVKELVPVPSSTSVSYLTPAGLALNNPTLSRTLSYAQVTPFMQATQTSVQIANAAAGKYGTPFDLFGHDVLTSKIKLREQYFSNFPYENEAEISRALIRNYKDSKVSGKISDVAVVKPGNAMALSDLLRDQLGYNEVMLSACRIFAVPGTTKVQTLSPEISRQVYLIMKRAYDYGDNVPTQLVKANLGAPSLSENTYQAMIGAHDALAELPAGQRLPLIYETSTKRYSFYQLLRLYNAEQNKEAPK